MGKLTINKIQQKSGRTPLGQDYLSGLMFYGLAPNVAGKWKLYNSSKYPLIVIKAQQLFSIDDAISAGIIPNTDNDASSSTYKITNVGSTGDKFKLTCAVPIKGRSTEIVVLCEYKVTDEENTIPLQITAIAAKINSNTYKTGFSAEADGDTVTVSAPKKYGIKLNTGTPYAIDATGDLLGTLTQNVGEGTASVWAAWYYHIEAYFTLYPEGNLWIGILEDETNNFEELLALQSASGNTLRLIGIYYSSVSGVGPDQWPYAIQSIQNTTLEVDQTFPFESVFSTNLVGNELTALLNGQDYKCNKVSFVISQDGNNEGELLYRCCGFSIGNIGAKIATLSKSRVSSSDAQAIDEFNLSYNKENEVPAFANGDLLSDTSENVMTQLKNYRYIFFQVFTGNVIGTFWTGNYTFCVQTHRYAFMNDNRIASKITRICNKTYIPLLEAEVIYNEDGTISQYSVEIMQDAGIDNITAECITGFGSMPLISGAPVVTIDPSQPLQETNNLQIVVKVGENGIARDITISQGFTN
jgi:hypothetical protein